MSERADSSPVNAGSSCQRNGGSGDDTTARQVLLREAQTATDRQLSQLTKIDDAAVRTVKITFLITGVFAGGSQLSHAPNLGVFGVLGTVSLVASLFGSLCVYGTSHLFIGSGPEDLDIDYESSPSTEIARIEVISKYEAGIRHNWNTLYVNGFVLAVSRLLLAFGVSFLVVGVAQAI